ncbi:MAG: ankyrin repeat domain-containing protein [Planctomycetes bacterium]|nr:ankyrin repeat domain-containing protein [Planctomycetota bacterium]
MTPSVRSSIDAGDADSLRALVVTDPHCATALVRWGEGGKHSVPPLHYVCDAVFRGLATQEEALAMANVLLDAGVDPDELYAASGDTFLIAAASLGAELVGIRLVEAGADVLARGLFGATALHWAALMGLARLTDSLVHRGSPLELRDERYRCTPLEWALHGWQTGAGLTDRDITGAVRTLRRHGALVPEDAVTNLREQSDDPMREALTAPTDRA